MGYNWEKIFKEKDEKELVKIYSGNSYLDYEASIYAGLELKNRNFDFQKIEKIHNEKIARLKMEIKDFENLEFIKSKYSSIQLLSVIGLSGLLYSVIKNKEEIIGDNYNFIRILIYGTIALIIILTAKWNFNRFKKNKKKTIEKKVHLLKMITKPNSKS